MGTKVLLYGNCQLAGVADWLNQFDSIDIIKPGAYDIEQTCRWAHSIFFPPTVLKNSAIYDALTEADYFIFQDVIHNKYIKSTELYESCTCNKLCVTNFHFGPFGHFLHDNQFGDLRSVVQSAREFLQELKRRERIMMKKYSDDVLSMLDFIRNNWRDKLLQGNMANHPTKHYYQALYTELVSGFFASLDLDPASIYHRKTYPAPLSDQAKSKIKKLFPNMIHD